MRRDLEREREERIHEELSTARSITCGMLWRQGCSFEGGSVFHRRHRARFVPRSDEFTRPIKRPRPGHTRVEQIARRKMPSSSSGWEILAWNGILSTSTWILRIKESTSCKTASRYYEGTRIRGRHSGLALHPRAVFLVFLPFSPIFAQPSSFLSSSLLFLAFSSIFTRLALDGKGRTRGKGGETESNCRGKIKRGKNHYTFERSNGFLGSILLLVFLSLGGGEGIWSKITGVESRGGGEFLFRFNVVESESRSLPHLAKWAK